MKKLQVKPNKEIYPQIYSYSWPDVPKYDGWEKIGYTERKDAKVRINEQNSGNSTQTVTNWVREARFNGGGYFRDSVFHKYIEQHGIRRDGQYEWFEFGENNTKFSEELFMKFTFRKFDDLQRNSETNYILREEQADAVAQTLEYAEEHPHSEFLWNAKPRFGKTLSAYDLVRQMDAHNVLIVTNRPAIANSWFDDFEKFIGWQTDFKFVSESESLKDRKPLSREQWRDHAVQNMETARQINFISLQDLKGSAYHGGTHDKLKWISDITWDILIIDEAHEGIDTFKTDIAFDNIKRNFTLHLSGTPFKAIADRKFEEEQVFNWSYQDEQTKKYQWSSEEENSPYDELPQLNMFTYQMSTMIADKINEGAIVDGDNIDFTFDLNEFFSTNQSGRFIHEKEVKKWLNTLTSNEKYPFSTRELRNELKHTFWILHRVASAKALAKMLNEHPVFENYKVIIAAGDGKSDEKDIKKNETSLQKVSKAIKKHDKTITLSVGQLTTGVTIPEWSAVLMLSNMESPALYMQAAFRAQNPHRWEDKETNKIYQKQNAYVFDFAPERTLIIFDEFANNLNTQTSGGGGTKENRENNIKRLLNFFPVIGEDDSGVMKELDFNDVLAIPNRIKSTEVVKRGFMSNLLFANISGIFGAPQIVLDTLNQLELEEQGRVKATDKKVETDGVNVDKDNEVVIDHKVIINKSDAILGDKVVEIEVPPVDDSNDRDSRVKDMRKAVMNSSVIDDIVEKTREEIDTTKTKMRKEIKELENKLDNGFIEVLARTDNKRNVAKKEFEVSLNAAVTDEEQKNLLEKYEQTMQELDRVEADEVDEVKEEVIEEWNRGLIENTERKEKEDKRNSIEDDVRSRLRGFSRTIPSFIMAYGDKELTLATFEENIPNDVFKEVTGITIEQFMFLRDGGEYEEDGQTKHFEGQLFNEMVFNESIQEFLNKKEELSNYFEDHDEDIFAYIPPQKTNQIFTPKYVVRRMVDALEEENPGIYDDSSKTFIDMYMKSGLYITEIVKRLYNSDVIKREIPNDDRRLKHVLENQVYGLAPTKIIYDISTNFIFGGVSDEVSRKNFKHLDVVPYMEEGTLEEKLDEVFGE